MTFLQAYWWLLISILGAILVFLLFVQGGQTLLNSSLNPDCRKLMVNSLGRKWEFTYTTLVVFGGAFFASFPLYYSTSFGGAYWLWMLILFSFVIQAVSYEFRSKPGNLFTYRTYDTFLFINGLVGTVLLGVAVGMFFFGGEFTVSRISLVEPGNPVISTWAPTHGLEAIANWKCLLLGFAVFFLARTQAALYFTNDIKDARGFGVSTRISVLFNGVTFALLFVGFVVVLMLQTGFRVDPARSGYVVPVANIYLHNMLDMWWTIPVFLGGVLAVLYGIFRTAFSNTWNKGIWWSGIGTVAVVFVLFVLAGFNNTAYLPSLTDPSSSLSVCNSCSSPYTLKTMAYASLIVPVVIAYIWVTWRKINAKPLTVREVDTDSHSY
ncbi:MAG: cytochrome d ubiquinol oxidase subunit II [Muribaculaceae bacterium]